jgi:hypothetical protein
MKPSMFPAEPAEAVPFFRGLRIRIGATIALLVGGLCWVFLYLAFLAGRFAWYQNLAIVLVSFLVVPAIVVLMWISWGVGVAGRVRHAFWDDEFP